MPTFPPVLNQIIRYLILAAIVVGGLGPEVTELAGVLPPKWFTIASHVVAAAAAFVAYAMQSPLFKPWLPVKSPQEVITQETHRQIDDVVTAEKKDAAVPTPKA